MAYSRWRPPPDAYLDWKRRADARKQIDQSDRVRELEAALREACDVIARLESGRRRRRAPEPVEIIFD